MHTTERAGDGTPAAASSTRVTVDDSFAADASAPSPPPRERSRARALAPGLAQFLKFCAVGVTSTLITFLVLNVCKFALHLPLFVSVTVAFLVSVVNGFVLNRRWTFKEARANSAPEQSLKFLAVNVVGYLLTTSIVVFIVAHFTTGGLTTHPEAIGPVLYNIMAGEGKQHYPPLLVNGAQAVATVIVVWWNFFANRFWTFKR